MVCCENEFAPESARADGVYGELWRKGDKARPWTGGAEAGVGQDLSGSLNLTLSLA